MSGGLGQGSAGLGQALGGIGNAFDGVFDQLNRQNHMMTPEQARQAIDLRALERQQLDAMRYGMGITNISPRKPCRELTYREQLQKETDQWLKTIAL